MSDEDSSRIFFRDRSGNPSWFYSRNVVKSWEPGDWNTRELPPDYNGPTISLLQCGVWILWETGPYATHNRRTQVLSEQEAIAYILEWGLDPGEHGKSSLAAMELTASRIPRRRLVFDSDANGPVSFYPVGCLEWTAQYGGNNSTETLLRFPKGHWVRVWETQQSGYSDGPSESISRMTDREAAEWLLENGFEVPADIRCFVEDRFFDPSKPVVRRTEVKPLAERPVWQAQKRELTLRGQVIRRVAPQATNLSLLLNVFHEDEWAERVDSPFTPDEGGKNKLRETVRQLNQGLQKVVFEADGTGEGIVWRLIEPIKEPATEAFESGDEVPF